MLAIDGMRLHRANQDCLANTHAVFIHVLMGKVSHVLFILIIPGVGRRGEVVWGEVRLKTFLKKALVHS